MNFEDVHGRESVRHCVPWFCMDEFRDVYHCVFTNDLSILRKGYNRLLMWKSRRQNLPPGVEATFNLCEVILQDGKLEESPEELFLPQLRLTYATTIMRFLNLVLGMVPGKVEKKTLCTLADAVGIPKWIVEIRHDSAHGSVLPDIGVLRSAARFSLDWLKEHYWERALKISDLVIETGEEIVTDYEHMVENVVECWESVAIYRSAQITCKKYTKNAELWRRVYEIGLTLKSKLHRPKKEVKGVDRALPILEQKIREMLRNRTSNAVKPVLIKRVISGDILLPSEKFLSLLSPDNANELSPAFLNIWRTFFQDVWESGSMPLLLLRLVDVVRDNEETAVRRQYAFLWMNQIVLSLIKVKERRRIRDGVSSRSGDFQLSHKYFVKYANCSYDEQLDHAITHAIEEQRPELKRAFNWKCLPMPHCFSSTEVLRKLVANPPPPIIHKILPSVMELMNPPLPQDMKECLLQCVQMYSDGEQASKTPKYDKLFSLGDLVNLDISLRCEENMTVETSNEENSKLEFSVQTNAEKTSPSANNELSIQTPWKQSDGILCWNRCALGILPWQYDDIREVWQDLEPPGPWKRKCDQL